MDTEKDFDEATGPAAVDTDDLALLTEVDEEEPVEVDEKLPEDAILNPELDLDEQKDPEDEDDVEAEIAAYMYQDYEER